MSNNLRTRDGLPFNFVNGLKVGGVDLDGPSGASKVGYDDGTLEDIANGAKVLQDYTELRDYNGPATMIRITNDGIAGLFKLDGFTTTTTEDNGGTTICAASIGAKRWKRVFDGAVSVKWFGATGEILQASHAGIQLAVNYCITAKKKLFFPNGVYNCANTQINIIGPIDIEGESEQGVILRTTKNDLTLPDGTGIGYAHLFRVTNKTEYGDIVLRNMTLDGGNASLAKSFRPNHKAFNAWRYATEDGVPSTVVKVRRFIFNSITVKNFEGEGLSGTGGGNVLGTEHIDYTEATSCTFSRNEGGSFNMNGSAYVKDCKFFDGAVIEMAVNRTIGTLNVQNCEFVNCARGGAGQVISVLNSGATGSLTGRAGTSFICKNNKFDNTRAHVESLIGSPHYFTTIAFYNIGNTDISNNYFRNSGRGRSNGYGCILVRELNDVVSISNNTFSVNDSFFTTDYLDLSNPVTTSFVRVNNNTYIGEFGNGNGIEAVRGPFGISDRSNKANKFVSSGNNIYIPSNLPFPSTFSNITGFAAPVRKRITIRAVLNIVTSVATNLRLVNASSGWLTLIYDGTPPVGETVVTVDVTTDNISAPQYISAFFINGNSDVTNTVTIEIDSI